MQELGKLVEKFDRNLKQYKSSSYDEANVRVDFIDKFFTLLSWDVSNEKGYSEDYREVVREDKVIIQGKPKAPDYSFRIGGARKFFVEAKKPSIDIRHAQAPAFQIRRYAYTAKLPLSILTDFEEFAVYDTRIKPDQKDDASVARVFYCKFTDYEKQWDYLNGTFSQDAILTGSFDKYISDKKRQKGTSEVDKEFLNTIDKWRVDLAKDIAKNNKDLETYDINYAVQKIIDRIVFLRFAEDQNIEEYGSLKKFLEAENKVYPQLDQFFKKADSKYNSSLFKPEAYISDLDIEDKTLHSIIRGLYYPKCPYEFSVLPIEILGSIYEKFLGKTIRLTASHQAKVEEKPEVRKAGGVYYTPQYIVDYIVENTIGEKLKNRKPDDFTSTRKSGEKRGARHGGRALGDEVTGRDLSLGGTVQNWNDVHTLTVLDPACGSGSFLVRAYNYLLKWYLEQYTKKQSINKNIKDGKIYQTGDNTYRLSIKTKQEVLKQHIYGVDIDRQAVEVTKLSLLLKLMEGESEQTSAGFLRFDQAQLLPDLSENIKCGNSLIGSDFYQEKNLSLFDTGDMHKINAFDWDSPEGFGEIMKRGGFDCVIGNPPYVRVRIFKELNNEPIVNYLESTYYCAKHVWDIYLLIFEKSISVLKEAGLVSFILPIQTLHQPNCESLRKFLYENGSIKLIADLSRLKVFKNAIIKNCIIVYKKVKSKDSKINLFYPEIESDLNDRPIRQWPFAEVSNNPGYSLKLDILSEKQNLCKKFQNKSYQLDKLFYATFGLRSSSKQKGGAGKDRLITKEKGENTKKYLEGRDIDKYRIFSKNNYIKYLPKKMYSPRTPKLFETNKIIGRSMLSNKNIIATLDTEDFYVEQSLVCIIPHGIITERNMENLYSLKFLLGLINSKLTTFYFSTYIIDYSLGGGLIHATPGSYSKFLIPKINFSNPTQKSQHDKMVSLVEQMLAVQKKLHETNSPIEKKQLSQEADILDKQIDALVYELYELTPEEIKIVEGET